MQPLILILLLSAATALPALDPSQAKGAAAPSRSSAVPDSILEWLELSLKNGKGLMFHLGQQSLGGAVTRIGEQTVEVRNREYSRIVIRLDRIDAVSMN